MLTGVSSKLLGTCRRMVLPSGSTEAATVDSTGSHNLLHQRERTCCRSQPAWAGVGAGGGRSGWPHPGSIRDIQFEALVEVPFRGAEGIGEGSKFTVEVDKFPIGTDPKAEQVKKPRDENLVAGIDKLPSSPIISPRVFKLHQDLCRQHLCGNKQHNQQPKRQPVHGHPPAP